MPNIVSNEFYHELLKCRLLPLFFNEDINIAQKITSACSSGGAKLLEFTNRGEGALDVFKKLRRFIDDKHIPLFLGAGSIMYSSDAVLFLSSGADFIVGPINNVEISRLCNQQKTAYIPGCLTPNEIFRAEEQGAEIVKIFPAGSIGGPEYIKNILGPMPRSKLLPTGGVEPERENLHSWFKAGAVAIGIGSKLIRQEWIKNNRYDLIQELTASVIGWLDELK